jgi:hypothetical protein
MALRAIGNTACLRLALNLSNLPVATKSFNLHLRNANLILRDVKLIASAMCKGEDISGPSLLSFSMSYNFNITDIGVQALVSVLPDTITDIGFVGCGLSDKAGLALLRWARILENLQLICIEENNFPQVLKDKFISLSKNKLPLSVVI